MAVLMNDAAGESEHVCVDRASGECKTVVIDLEMCKVPKSRRFGYGLSMEIIQIGAVSLDENGEILDKFVSFVRPEYGFIDSAINRLTGIRQYDVKNAPILRDVLARFTEWLGSSPVVMSSWSMTDRAQLYSEIGAKGIDGTRIQSVIQAWEDCQAIFSEKMDNVHRRYSLDYAIKVTDIQMDEKEHDALADAYNTALLYQKMKREKTLQLNKYYVRVFRNEVPDRLQYSVGEALKGIKLYA